VYNSITGGAGDFPVIYNVQKSRAAPLPQLYGVYESPWNAWKDVRHSPELFCFDGRSRTNNSNNNRTGERARTHTVSRKRIPDIIDCNLKEDGQILIVFGTNIPDTTGH